MPVWRDPALERRVSLALLAVCWLLCAATALTEPLDRDEHMYLTAARLSGELQLYEDFAFLQTPYSVGVYRLVLALTPDPWTLLPARGMKILVTGAMIALLFVALRRLGARPLLAAGLVTLLYQNEQIRETASLARNYDFAQISILAGICLVPLRAGDDDGPWRMIAVGMLAAVAVGFKLTYAPLAALLVAWPLVAAGGRRLTHAGWIGVGAFTGMLPAVAVMVGVDPAALQFNLLEYHFLNAELHSATGYEPLASLWDRISRTGGNLLAREQRPLFAMTVFAVTLNVAPWSRPRTWTPGYRAWFVLIFLVAAAIMAAVPRPIQGAYFGPAYFGMVLFVAVASDRLSTQGARAVLVLCLVTAAISAAMNAGYEVRVLTRALDPDHWTGVTLHRNGEQVAALAAPGLPVLTTHPLVALEGGRTIYPELATGEFTWRAGKLLGDEQRTLIRSTSEESFADLLVARPPGAVITESDAFWDEPLAVWAAEAGWIEHVLDDARVRVWAP